MMDSNYFANLIAAAPMQTSSRYFEAGIYLVEIDNCKIFSNRQRRPRAAVECTVIESNNDDFPQTTQVSWIVSLDSDSGPSELKSFIASVTGCRPSEVTNDVFLNFFINADDPNSANNQSIAIGLQAIVNAYEKQTKSGGVFTKVSWKKFNAEKDSRPNFAGMPKAEAKSQEIVSTNEQKNLDSDPIPF